MDYSYLKRIISILVCLSIICGFIPISPLPTAAAAPDLVNKPSLVEKPEKFPQRPAQKTEITKWRSANARQFINPNGSFTAEVFQDSIYYQDESKVWKDIDNNLKTSVEPGFAYENGANRFKINFARNAGEGILGRFKLDDSILDFSIDRSFKDTRNN